MLSGLAASQKGPLRSGWEHREGSFQLAVSEWMHHVWHVYSHSQHGEGGCNTIDAPDGNPLESLPHQRITDWVSLWGYKRNSPGSATRKVGNEMLPVSAGRWEARLDRRICGGEGAAHPRPSPQPPAISAWFSLHSSLSTRSAGIQEATKW